MPVGIYAPSAESFEEAVLGLTEAKRVIRLHRLPAGTILSENPEQFMISAFHTLEIY